MKELKRLEKTCYICNRVVAVLVGTPIVKKSGFRLDNDKTNTTFMFSRPAHIECFLGVLGIASDNINYAKDLEGVE